MQRPDILQSRFRQLPLGFEPRDVFTFDSFIVGENKIPAGLVQQCALGEGEKQIFIWSAAGSGKSHLLQAACNLAAKNNRTVCYLPAAELITQSVQSLDELEQVDFVCVDDVERMAQIPAWEEALFDLINRMREADGNLLMGAAMSPEAMRPGLQDLRSRLMWGPVFQLQPLNDAEKFEALRRRAHQSGLELPQNVADYLMRHFPRDLFGLFERLDKLDKASMAMQRRLTVPFVKSVLGEE